jgi:sec-independent protein translocase protein TatC
MRKILSFLSRIVVAPFRLIFWLISLPFRLLGRLLMFLPFVRKLHDFMTFEPEDRPLTESLGDLLSAGESFWEHVEAIRHHLFRILAAVIITVGFSLFYATPIMEFLAQPVGGLGKLKAFQMTEGVGAFMSVGFATGFTIAIPYIAFEIWLFIAPGVSAHSRRIGLIAIPLAFFLFLSGVAFTYYVMLAPAAQVLWTWIPVEQLQSVQSYFNFITGLMFWIGLGFEFPLVIYVLSAIGFVKPWALAHQWRLAVLIIAVIAAAVTPTVDPINMSLVMVPMIALYFVSIGLSYVAYAGRRKPEGEV